MAKTIDIQVPKGTQVRVHEVDLVRDDDPRIPDDRNLILTTGHDVKIAIKKIDDKGAALQATASVTTMCG